MEYNDEDEEMHDGGEEEEEEEEEEEQGQREEVDEEGEDEDEETDFEEDLDEDMGEQREETEPDTGTVFDPAAQGLKEISNLGKIILSSFKPGNGVEALRSDDLTRYWQSDGPQPHRLTMHFIRRVQLRSIRFYVDYNEDESYTPTRIGVRAGTGWHDLHDFCEVALSDPVGWQEVPLTKAGAGADGNSLACWIFQLVILENHQNGKDTHIRGLEVYALQDTIAALKGPANPMEEMLDAIDVASRSHNDSARFRGQGAGDGGVGGGASRKRKARPVAGDIGTPTPHSNARGDISRLQGPEHATSVPAASASASNRNDLQHQQGPLPQSEANTTANWVNALHNMEAYIARGEGSSLNFGVPDFMKDPEIR